MELPIDVEVYCTDGIGGKSSAIVLNPETKEVTHLAVRTKGWLNDEYMVPLNLVVSSAADRITLSCSLAEMAELPPFERTVFIGVDGDEMKDDDMNEALMSSYAFVPGGEYPGQVYPPTLQEEQLPIGELSIHPGTDVVATDGKVGEFHEFVVDAETDRITHLVLREGHLWGKKDVTIPVDQIASIEAEAVHLKLDKAAVERLPSVRAH
jgi:uncharacterized protein YrrD